MRIRTYTTVSQKKYYSAWSKAKTVKTTGTKANLEFDEQDVNIESDADETLLATEIELDGEIVVDSLIEMLEAMPQGDIVVTIVE